MDARSRVVRGLVLFVLAFLSSPLNAGSCGEVIADLPSDRLLRAIEKKMAHEDPGGGRSARFDRIGRMDRVFTRDQWDGVWELDVAKAYTVVSERRFSLSAGPKVLPTFALYPQVIAPGAIASEVLPSDVLAVVRHSFSEAVLPVVTPDSGYWRIAKGHPREVDGQGYHWILDGESGTKRFAIRYLFPKLWHEPTEVSPKDPRWVEFILPAGNRLWQFNSNFGVEPVTWLSMTLEWKGGDSFDLLGVSPHPGVAAAQQAREGNIALSRARRLQEDLAEISREADDLQWVDRLVSGHQEMALSTIATATLAPAALVFFPLSVWLASQNGFFQRSDAEIAQLQLRAKTLRGRIALIQSMLSMLPKPSPPTPLSVREQFKQGFGATEITYVGAEARPWVPQSFYFRRYLERRGDSLTEWEHTQVIRLFRLLEGQTELTVASAGMAHTVTEMLEAFDATRSDGKTLITDVYEWLIRHRYLSGPAPTHAPHFHSH